MLISLGKDRRALTAAFQYLIMGTIGATFYLIGVGLLYMMTGTSTWPTWRTGCPAVADTRTVHAAFAFLVDRHRLKAAIFPLHLWLPNAYCYAPSVVTAFLAATATKVSVYVLLRLLFTVFGWASLLSATRHLGGADCRSPSPAMLVASTVAIFQTNAKRLLAYSSVAQIGYMVLGISFASVTGLTAGIVHLFNHAMIKGGLFLALGASSCGSAPSDLEDMAGLGKQMPWTMAAFVAGGLSLIGVPLTTGFISKWVLVQAAWKTASGTSPPSSCSARSLAIAYVWRDRRGRLLPSQAPEGAAPSVARRRSPCWYRPGSWSLANVYFGIDTSLTLGVAGSAATALFGGRAMSAETLTWLALGDSAALRAPTDRAHRAMPQSARDRHLDHRRPAVRRGAAASARGAGRRQRPR